MTSRPEPPARQLAAFFANFDPAIARLGRAARGKLRRLLPGAIEFVYDNYYALVIGYGATERPSDAVLSLVLYPRKVALCFLRGVGLPDPTRILEAAAGRSGTSRCPRRACSIGRTCVHCCTRRSWRRPRRCRNRGASGP